jgi:hypothetical protein
MKNLWHTCRMSDENLLSLPPAAKARRDLMTMGMEIASIQAQVAQMPTRSDLARAALGIIFCTATVTSLLGWWLMTR